jgi:phosphotransferase system  glucose/maltose/N-acetylglucosamine-specific IIC component
MMPPMQSQPQRGRKWRRFVRNNRNLLFTGFLLVIILAFVTVIFWVMTSPRFVKMH